MTYSSAHGAFCPFCSNKDLVNFPSFFTYRLFNLIYLTFDVTNREIAKQLNIQFQTTLVIYKNNKEVYRSLGELTKDKIYKAINSVI